MFFVMIVLIFLWIALLLVLLISGWQVTCRAVACLPNTGPWVLAIVIVERVLYQNLNYRIKIHCVMYSLKSDLAILAAFICALVSSYAFFV
jgi:hypothetical protein